MQTRSGQVPNEAGLDDEQLQVLRERLERLSAELGERLARASAVPRESEAQVEPLDAAEQTREQDDAILFATHERALLREVEHALAKMSTSRYGLSEVSGDPIPYKRLLAVPWARYDSDEAATSDDAPSG